MTSPKLSIIIPTRERSDVLPYSLRTLVDQDYTDCEFIVSDNHSKDNTKQVVESLTDPRLRYINTGKRVSMAMNWEFGFSHARGTFVTFLGDDDGFVPGALAGAMRILEKAQVNALVWEKIEYCWPDYVDGQMRNWTSLKNREYALQMAQGRRKMHQVIKCRETYNKLPCLYNAIVRKSLIDRLRVDSTNGVLFNAIAPDVYSGIVLSQIVGGYLWTDYPLSVNGASRHSIGTSFTKQAYDVVEDNPKKEFIAENEHEYDSRLSFCPSIWSIVMGEYLQAMRYLPGLCLAEPPWHRYVKALIRDSTRSLLADEILRSAAHTAKKMGLRISVPEHGGSRCARKGPRIGFAGDHFSFIPPAEMVKNIHDACRLVSGMLPDMVEIRIRSPLGIFLRRLWVCAMVEMRALYRSIGR